jgi:hypothetical protein
MKINKILLTFALVTSLSVSSFAQGGGYWNFTWDIGFPLSTTSEFISATSLRGFAVEGRGYATDRLLVGGRIAWNTFYENNGWVTETSENQTITIYGYERRYMNAMPIMATAHYEFGNRTVLPYAGLGVGTYYINSRDYMGIYYTQDQVWHFGVYPEVGIVIPLGGGTTGIDINAKYNYAAKTKDASAESWISLGIGLSYIF